MRCRTLLVTAIGLLYLLSSTVSDGSETSWPHVEKDFFIEASRGALPHVDIVNQIGRNPDTDKKGSPVPVFLGRDIWDLGIAGATPWLPPTAARIHQIASCDDEDGGAGGDTGALSVRIMGLDPTFERAQEDLELDGLTAVPTTIAYTMIYRMDVLTAGSVGRNVCHIDATADVDGTVTARISTGNNRSAMAIYQCPADKTCYIVFYDAFLTRELGVETFAAVSLMIKSFGGVWMLQRPFGLSGDGGSNVDRRVLLPIKVVAKSYVKMIANPSKDGQDISAGFSMLLIDTN